MNSPKLRHSLNYDKHDKNGEKNSDPSCTQPNMAMSIPELMKRHMQGKPLPRSKNLAYASDGSTEAPYLPDMRKLDMVERDELVQNNQNHIKNLETQMENTRKERNKLAQEKQQKIKAAQKQEFLEAAKNEVNKG